MELEDGKEEGDNGEGSGEELEAEGEEGGYDGCSQTGGVLVVQGVAEQESGLRGTGLVHRHYNTN